MASSVDYRSISQHAADVVYAAMVDPAYLQARLIRLGGPGAALEEHAADAQGARYRLRHGLDESQLPSGVRMFLAGDIVVERAESWQRTADGHYDGELTVQIPGTPASAQGWMRLADLDTGGSEYVVHADVQVKVPLIGGKIEATVSEQMISMLEMESAFTTDYVNQS